MSLTSEDRKEIVSRELLRAQSNLQEARQCADIELWNVVGNRIYYSVFHAVVALLVNCGIEVGSHKGAGMMFGKHFILTGVFSSEDGKLFRKLQSLRERADYDNIFHVSPDIGKQYLEEASALVGKITNYIRRS